MFFFDKKISNLIESQFPATYRDNGPDFVAFVKAYYEWMEEEGNANYHARRLLEYRDVDSTVDQFLKYFKSKYLNNIQYDTVVSTPSFVKHSLDLYRSKGTERAIDLFFKSVFGVPADVYFPAKDIFKTSSGIWVEPKYLEIEPGDDVLDFVGLQVEGLDSGAKAFVEKYVRKHSAVSSHVAHVYFISSITGLFQTGERIRASASGQLGPIVIGSMTSLDIFTGASGFNVGDIVDVTSTNNGRNGKARVSAVETTSGKVSFELENGGWGYNSNSEIILSEKMLIVSNLENDSASVSFTQFETVSQPLANLHYVSLTGEQFLEGDRVVRMDGSNVIADAVVISIDRISNTEGYVLLSTASSKFDLHFDATMEDGDEFAFEDDITMIFEEDNAITSDGILYKVETTINEAGDELSLEDLTEFLIEGSVGSANISGYVDVTASANVMKYSTNVSIEIVGGSEHFADDMEVFQYSNDMVEVANATIETASYFGSNATLRLVDVSGKFRNGTVQARSSTTNAEIVSVTVNVGLFNVNNDFIDTEYAPIYGLTSNTFGTVTSVSQGFGASISISNTFLYEETVAINTDDIGDYLSIQLDASDYGFPASGTETITTLLEDAFSYNIEDYGRISSIVVTNSGEDYNFSPYVIVYEKDLYAYNKRDFIVNVSNVAGTFLVGEIVQQSSLNVGIVKSGSNSSVLFLERITFGDLAETTIEGLISNATADVDYVYADASSDPVGLNALIIANTATSNGTVSSLEIVSSGFGYYDGELVTFSKEGNDDTGTAHVELRNQGIAQGYHRENNSLLSDGKYIQDGYYYQEFSYEVRSSIVLEKYAEMLKNVVHVAGTTFFSKFVFESDLSASIGSNDAELDMLDTPQAPIYDFIGDDEDVLGIDFSTNMGVVRDASNTTNDFAGSLSSMLTVTRASGGTVIDGAGKVTWNSANNTLRFGHAPLTLDSSNTEVTIEMGLKTFTTTGTIDYRSGTAAWANATAYSAGAHRYDSLGRSFICTADHTSNSETKPVDGSMWHSYWDRSGKPVRVSDQANLSNYMVGTVYSYSNGQLTLNVDSIGGSGTKSSWHTIESLGLLVEEPRTNYLKMSADFSNSSIWSISSNTAITANAIVSPDGTTSGIKIESLETAARCNQVVTAFPNTAAFYSIYAKKGSAANQANRFVLRNNTTATNLIVTDVNLDTGSATITGTGNVTTTSIGNGWWRIIISTQTGITAGNELSCYTGFAGGTSTAGHYVYVWGAQLEVGFVATSYIPTTSSTALRAADIITKDITTIPWVETEGTMAASFRPSAVPQQSSLGDSTCVISFNQLGGADQVNLQMNGSSASTNFRLNGATRVPALAGTNITANTVNGMAGGWTASSATTVLNGSTLGTPLSSPPLPDDVGILNIGRSAGNFGYLNQHIRRFIYFPTRKSDTQLRVLSTV